MKKTKLIYTSIGETDRLRFNIFKKFKEFQSQSENWSMYFDRVLSEHSAKQISAAPDDYYLPGDFILIFETEEDKTLFLLKFL